MIVLAIIALGVVSVRNLAVDLFPEIDLPIAVVATTYDDAAPEEVENLISKPIENAISSVEGIEEIQSQSQANASLVIMMFKNGTDLDQALLDVRERIDQVSDFLPERAGAPNIMRFSPDQLPVIWVGITGNEADVLTELAEKEVVPIFERQHGVASVSVEGAKTREIQLILDRAALMKYQLSEQDVMQAISSTNQAASVGTIEKGTQDLQVRISGEYETIEDIENTTLRSQSGATVKLSDIAEVKDTFKEESSLTLINGEPSVVLSVLKKTDANTVEVANQIIDVMTEAEERLPADVNLNVVIDTSEFIEEAVDSIIQNILIGGAISVFILLLFLKSIRATLVIALSIPIAIISTFALMYFTGETLNILTLGGLALGIGMMVDSSIVILENIYSYRQKGHSLFESATKGASELAPAVIASTTTTLVVFLPIVYVEGLASDLFTPLALTVSFSLIASLVVAVTLVPMLSSKMLSKAMDDGRRYWFDRFLQRVTDAYTNALRTVLKYRKTSVLVTIVLIAGSLALTPLIGAEFMPAADQGQLEIRAETQEGSTLEETEKVVDEINEVLKDYEDIIDINFVSVGSDGFTTFSTSTNVANYTMQLVPVADRSISTEEFVKRLDEQLQTIVGADITVSEIDAGMGALGSDPIQIQLTGPEHDVLRELADQVTEEIGKIDGVFNPESGATAGVPQLHVDVNKDKASAYGLSVEHIQGQIEMNFIGQPISVFRDEGREIDITLTYPEETRKTIAQLQNMKLHTEDGTQIALRDVASFEEVQGPVSLVRYNQQAYMSVTSELIDRDLGSVMNDIVAHLEQLDWPEGYYFSIGGQAEDMEEAFGDLTMALIFSIFLVYAVMAVQFENFLFPFIIMFSMPATVVGIIGGLFVTNLSFSIPAFIGVIMLAGIVVNNSIVLVDYINILRRRGMERYEAIIEAGRSRLRPILMTTLTTVLGMIPLGLALGEGAEMQQPLAIAIIFGLSVSSIFTLLLIPIIYQFFDDLTMKILRRDTNLIFKEQGEMEKQ